MRTRVLACAVMNRRRHGSGLGGHLVPAGDGRPGPAPWRRRSGRCPARRCASASRSAPRDRPLSPETALVERWNGATWALDPVPPSPGGRVAELKDVACTPTSLSSATRPPGEGGTGSSAHVAPFQRSTSAVSGLKVGPAGADRDAEAHRRAGHRPERRRHGAGRDGRRLRGPGGRRGRSRAGDGCDHGTRQHASAHGNSSPRRRRYPAPAAVATAASSARDHAAVSGRGAPGPARRRRGGGPGGRPGPRRRPSTLEVRAHARAPRRPRRRRRARARRSGRAPRSTPRS